MEGLGNTTHSKCPFLQWFFPVCIGQDLSFDQAGSSCIESLQKMQLAAPFKVRCSAVLLADSYFDAIIT